MHIGQSTANQKSEGSPCMNVAQCGFSPSITDFEPMLTVQVMTAQEPHMNTDLSPMSSLMA